MNTGIRGLRGVALAAAALIVFAGCGPSDSPTASSPAGDVAAPAPAAASDARMTSGCDAVHQLFAALGSGDKASAESLKKKGADIFNDVAATDASKNVQRATDAAAMASILDFELPEEPIYQSSLADTYKVDCVARYGAATLPTS